LAQQKTRKYCYAHVMNVTTERGQGDSTNPFEILPIFFACD
jgi:hypothetical protein